MKTNWPLIALCIALLPIPTLFLGWIDGKLVQAIWWMVAEYLVALGILTAHYWKKPA